MSSDFSQSSTRAQASTISLSSGSLGIVTPSYNILPPISYNPNNLPKPASKGHHNHYFSPFVVAHDFHKSYHSALRIYRDRSYRPPLKINPGLDVILITGGVGGLGHQIALLFSQRKTPFKVIVLDLHLPDKKTRLPGVVYYQCDVSNIDELSLIARTIRQDHGTITVLINNAGVMKGARPAVELGYNEMRSTLDTNLLSSFLTIRTFVPDMIARHRGYVVTIGSVLGYVSPAKLSLYGASKAGLIALHESLTYELGPPASPETGVRTLLVCPGQLKTALFMDVRPPYPFVAPVLEPAHVARAIIEALESGRRGELKLPLYVNGIPFLRTLPRQLSTAARALTGIDTSI